MSISVDSFWETNLEELSEQELWEHYEKCLKKHDWTYDFTEEEEIRQIGQTQFSHLAAARILVGTMDEKRATEMYFEYCPFLHDEDQE